MTEHLGFIERPPSLQAMACLKYNKPTGAERLSIKHRCEELLGTQMSFFAEHEGTSACPTTQSVQIFIGSAFSIFHTSRLKETREKRINARKLFAIFFWEQGRELREGNVKHTAWVCSLIKHCYVREYTICNPSESNFKAILRTLDQNLMPFNWLLGEP